MLRNQLSWNNSVIFWKILRKQWWKFDIYRDRPTFRSISNSYRVNRVIWSLGPGKYAFEEAWKIVINIWNLNMSSKKFKNDIFFNSYWFSNTQLTFFIDIFYKMICKKPVMNKDYKPWITWLIWIIIKSETEIRTTFHLNNLVSDNETR